MRPNIASVFIVAGLLGASAEARATPLPVVVAVDVSRSLDAGELASGLGQVGDRLRSLDPEIPVGLLAFADSPEWLLPIGASPTAVAEALGRLAPVGRHTLLHDALFVAARALPEGGTVLVVTDGRDEDSATTVEDVARLATANRVRLLTVSVGRRVDERVLRRLALLTGGAHLGDVAALDVATLVVERPPPPAPAAASPTLAPPVAASDRASRTLLGRRFVLVAAILAAALIAGWWLARRRRPEPRSCPVCGSALETWETSCSSCEIESLERTVRTAPVAVAVPIPAPDEQAGLDPSVFVKDELPPDLDVTVTLDQVALLLVSRAGEPPRAYQLPVGQVFAVGRAPGVNSLVVSDPAVSGQHFKLVPKNDEWYVVDLGTTNGTTVERERVRVRKLESGNIIRAGVTEFTFEIRTRGLSYDTRDPATRP